MKKLLIVLPLCLLLSGCLTFQKFTFTFDYASGRTEMIYHDIRSQTEVDDKENGIEEDWASLQELVDGGYAKDLDSDVVKPVKAELFQEEKVLSGKKVLEVQLPKAFPSKTALLERLLGNENEAFLIKTINDEIFLFTGSMEVLSANGTILKSPGNNMVVWPADKALFEFTVDQGDVAGESLLPLFLDNENKIKP